MKNNIGLIDKVIRILFGLGLLYCGLIFDAGFLGIGLIIISIIPFVTAVLGNCPLYNLLGISTRKTNSQLPYQ